MSQSLRKLLNGWRSWLAFLGITLLLVLGSYGASHWLHGRSIVIVAACTLALVNALFGLVVQFAVAPTSAEKGKSHPMARTLAWFVLALVVHSSLYGFTIHQPRPEARAVADTLKASGKKVYEASAPIEGHGGRFLVCNDNRLTWVDEEGRNVWQYGTNLDSLDKVMPNATPVERPVLTDFIVEDVLSDRPGDEVVLIWTHPEWPVSCLQIASADGGYVGDPLWSFGRLTSVVLLSGPTGKLLVVAGESHSIFDYEPSLADWGTKMKISRLNVPRNPPILFGIKPENAHGLVPPFMGVPYLSMATLEWLLVRKCDTNKELTDYGWNLTIRNIEPATRPDSFNAVVSVSKNTSGMRTGDPMLFRISFDAYGRRIDSVGFSRWALRSTAEPTLNMLRIEPERLTLIVTAIFENQRQTGSALRMKQLLRRSSWFTSDDTPWIEGVVDRLWSSPIAINNAVWLMICTGSTPDVDVCEEWLDSMTLALTDPGVPVEVRRAVQNTIGELHFLNGDLDRARTVLSESICQSSDPVYSVARLVSICWKQNDLDAVKHYLELLKSLVAKRQAGYDRFREKLLREAEDIERDMRARKTPIPPST